MTEQDTAQLAALIDNKFRCLVDLREMGVRQLEMIHGGQMTGLLKVLGAKQNLIQRLQRIERALDPYRHQDPESRPWGSQQQREKSARELEACEKLLAEIVDQEKQCQTELTLRRDQAAVQLREVHHADEVRGTYRDTDPRKSRQLDLASG